MTPTTSNHQESDVSEEHSHINTILHKLYKILLKEKPDELQVHIPLASNSVSAILEELNSEEQLNNEPDIQMIGRGDFHDGITIINIDDIIQSRVKSLNVPDMSAEQDPRTTCLSDT